jgi:NhaP-type Na+/H+ or K+/H+ antiporter
LAFPPLEAQTGPALLQSPLEQQVWLQPQLVLPEGPVAAVVPALFAGAVSLRRQAWKSWRDQFLV